MLKDQTEMGREGRGETETAVLLRLQGSRLLSLVELVSLVMFLPLHFLSVANRYFYNRTKRQGGV